MSHFCWNECVFNMVLFYFYISLHMSCICFLRQSYLKTLSFYSSPSFVCEGEFSSKNCINTKTDCNGIFSFCCFVEFNETLQVRKALPMRLSKKRCNRNWLLHDLQPKQRHKDLADVKAYRVIHYSV